ncbi:MAG TPA: tetratricopeptide repeat protein [Terriglobales bacterium]|nr:tetratricopeptide repeat protein [Terriglobales bacterium]
MKKLLASLLLSSAFVFAQSPSTKPNTSTPATPASNTPTKVDKAAAYYHFTMAHTYEEQMAAYGRSDLVSKAIEEYRLALEADPTSEYLSSGLAELYARTGRIRDAVSEAQDILKRDPQNLEAHRLLGHIYLRSLGDMQGGNGSDSVLKLAIQQYEEIIKLDPKSVDDHIMLGRLYHADNQMKKAQDEEQLAIKLSPDSEEAVATLAMFYSEEGDAAKAADTLSTIPEANRSAKLYLMLGGTYDQQKDYKKSIDAYQHAIALDRDNLDAIRGLAEALMNDGQTAKALQQFQVIADANPEDARTYVRIAEIYRRQGKLDQALQSLKKAQSMVKDSDQISYGIAEIYQAQGRYDDAIQQLQALLKSGENKTGNDEQDNRSIFLERLGTVYRDNNQEQQAIDTFRQMLSLGDDNAKRGYQELIDTYREAKDWQKATDVAKEATEKLPNDRDLKIVYASQIADMGQSDQAIQQVKSMLKGNADDRDIYVRLAMMYSRLKRWSDADAMLDKAEQLSTKPEDRQEIMFLRASGDERQKKYAEAEELFRKLIKEAPENAAALNYLGYMMADRGENLDEALGMIKKAVDQEPANGAYLDSLGWAYFKLGKYDLAEDSLLKASQHVMGADPTVQEHLGDLYQKTGRLKLAAAHWERSVAEWNKTVAPEVDQEELAKVQKKLESAKVRLAKEQAETK